MTSLKYRTLEEYVNKFATSSVHTQGPLHSKFIKKIDLLCKEQIPLITIRFLRRSFPDLESATRDLRHEISFYYLEQVDPEIHKLTYV
jgi:hypothetical protein